MAKIDKILSTKQNPLEGVTRGRYYFEKETKMKKYTLICFHYNLF